MAGTLTPDAGEVRLAGGHNAVAVVWQDLALCEDLDSVANLFLGPGERSTLVVGSGDARHRPEAAPRTRHRHQRSAAAGELPFGGQRQSLAVARVLLDRARLLVLGDPTASLGVIESRTVERILRELRAANCALLLISHRIEQVFGLADRIVVLRYGVVPIGADETIETVLAPPPASRLLGTDATTPMLLLTRSSRDELGVPVEYVRSLYRGDRFRFVARLTRPGPPSSP